MSANTRVPTIAVVGRTNVGKSTLFNRIVGRRIAVVEDLPGVTRDRNYALVTRYGTHFSLIDTGGLIGEDDNPLQYAVRQQTEVALREADIVLAVFDGLSGVHPHDYEVVDQLRRAGAEVVWVINKCERPATEEAAAEFYQLGIEEFYCISAAHNVGIDSLCERFMSMVAGDASRPDTENAQGADIRVAVLGRPNTGKSTLVNRILGEERLVTSDIPGTTCDSVDIELVRDGQRYTIVDTAGLRKKAKVDDASVERFSTLRSLKALAQCDVACVLVDATRGGPSEQDVKVFGLAHERGRAIVLVVNKWDLVEKDHKTVKEYTDFIREELKFAPYIPIVFVSALTGRRCPAVLDIVKRVHEKSQQRIPTADVNKVVTQAFERKPPPRYRGAAIKLFFATQVETAPPTFCLFVSHPKQLNFSYRRYVKNSLRKAYDFEGSDIKLKFKRGRAADQKAA